MRDGLQNEAVYFSVQKRASLAKKLCDAGLKRIELGAFVSPLWVPQMADTPVLFRRIHKAQKEGKLPRGVQFSALVPNLKGLENAKKSGVREIAIFGSSSETFSRKNINCSIKESLVKFKEVANSARSQKIKVRGYLSTAVSYTHLTLPTKA